MYMYVYTRVSLSTVAASMFSSYTALKMTGIAERHDKLCFKCAFINWLWPIKRPNHDAGVCENRELSTDMKQKLQLLQD